MRWLLRSACVLGLLCTRTMSAQVLEPPTPKQPKLPPGHTRAIILWPGGAPGALGTKDGDIPRLFVFPAPDVARETVKERRQRTGVIIMPGGSYRTLTMEKEGSSVAHWLNARGVDAFVLQYRLGPKYHFPDPMLDGARAVRYLRSHAGELELDPNRIGVWGFSAGGHLSGYLATMSDPGDPRSPDPIQRVSDRPDFAILYYARLSMDPSIPRPTNLDALIGDRPAPQTIDQISIERHVTRSTSPSFIFSTTADERVNSLTATAYYDALKRNGIAAELHIFERGPHGVGLGMSLRSLPELEALSTLVENWMQVHGWMKDRPARSD